MMSDSAEKSKPATATQTAPSLRPLLPAPAGTTSKGDSVVGNGKTVRIENDATTSGSTIISATTTQTINQQLASHLASASGAKLPLAKRKRGSLDSHLTGFRMKPPTELRRLGFIGAGNMARALAEGWITGGQINYASMTATVRSVSSPNIKLMKNLGVAVSVTNQDVIGQCDIIVIAVKPYQVMDVMRDIHQTFKSAGAHTPKSLRPLVVSVAASVPLAEIEKKAEISWNIGGSSITGHLPIIRCIPNIACAAQSGVTVFSRGKYCNEEDVKPFVTLFSALGHCEEVEEKYMDSFVALTGSGLGFMEVALEAMADGGVMAGIPHPISLRLSAHTMIGAANLVLKKGLHPAQVKNSVASPAGTTISGVLALESGGFRSSMITAVKAAYDKAVELRQS